MISLVAAGHELEREMACHTSTFEHVSLCPTTGEKLGLPTRSFLEGSGERELITALFTPGPQEGSRRRRALLMSSRTIWFRRLNSEGEKPSPASPLHRRGGVQAPKACSKAALV